MIFFVMFLLTLTGPVRGFGQDRTNCTISRPLDIAIVFDASESMVNESLIILKTYISNLIKNLDVDEMDRNKGVQVSLYGYQYAPMRFCNFSTCSSKNATLDVIDQMQTMEFTAVNIAGMFAFVRDGVFLRTEGARSDMANVEKIAITILDSPLLPYSETALEIQGGLQKNNISTIAVVIEGRGATDIAPFLTGPEFAVSEITDLATFDEVEKELEARYGCSDCHPNPCKNNGLCDNQLVFPYFKCKCESGWTGSHCERKASDPCARNSCNNYTCVAISPTLHRCVCPSYCSGSSDCSSCRKIEPCSSNPCLNGCRCKISPNHQGGFVCTSPAGYLGTLCDLPKAKVNCRPYYIEVKIPETVVKHYETGISGARVYVSPTFKNVFSSGCVGVLDSSQTYRDVKIPAPFQSCGTTRTPVGDGFQYQNTVWLNRFNPLLEMPVPLMTFRCVYGNSQQIVSTALKPAIGHIPSVFISGRFEVRLKAYMRPPGVKHRRPVSSGSTYTVGEMLYLTASLMTNTSHDLVVKLVNCYASAAPNLEHGKVDLVTNGCPAKSLEVTILGNAQQRNATFGFKAFRLLSSTMCYYSCQIHVCERKDPSCSLPVCISRRKRSIDVSMSKLVRVGPFIILGPEQQENFTGFLREKGISQVGAGDLPDENIEVLDTGHITTSPEYYVIVTILASFVVILLISGVVLCFLI